MINPASLPPVSSAQPHNSLTRQGWRRLRRDRIGFAALCVLAVYLLIALGAWSGLLARHWQDEVAVSFAPPTLLRHLAPQHVQLNAADIDAANHQAAAASSAADSSAATGVSASDDPLAADMAAAQQQAKQYRTASSSKAESLPFGADQRGRDVLQKVLQGTATSLLVGLSGALLALAIGTVLGALSGYFGGLLDDALMWFYSVFTSLPDLLLLLAFAAVSGRGVNTMVMVMALTSWTGTFRLMRAEFIKHKCREYVRAANAIGAGHVRRMLHHILPNVSHLLLVQFSLLTVALIKYEAVMSFLGFGVGVGQVSWGAMLSEAPSELLQGYWWQMLTVTVFMSVLVTAFSLLTDSLRDALDPKAK
ncbi:ABC transporter permease [Vogesella sp. LIG4]|uniref:ABC transporter permease n=1 Tax=Vogesella sp. LIG4 TaxID=1192162 RepID=UPI00081FEF1F|nr:ABC transporter permease [Vogesella sp. LIG4]SCK06913.1 peptide/nickel transport system permease protein [Vogesella sp. LIG4]